MNNNTRKPVLSEVVARHLESIRRDGACNMLDRDCIQVRALEREFYELAGYLHTAPKAEYAAIVFTGATVEETGQDLKDVKPL